MLSIDKLLRQLQVQILLTVGEYLLRRDYQTEESLSGIVNHFSQAPHKMIFLNQLDMTKNTHSNCHLSTLFTSLIHFPSLIVFPIVLRLLMTLWQANLRRKLCHRHQSHLNRINMSI